MLRSVDTEQSPFYSEVRHAGKKTNEQKGNWRTKKIDFSARRSGSAPHFQSSARALALSCRKGGTIRSLEGLGFLVPTWATKRIRLTPWNLRIFQCKERWGVAWNKSYSHDIKQKQKNKQNQSALWANLWIDTWFFGLRLILSGLGNFVVDCLI